MTTERRSSPLSRSTRQLLARVLSGCAALSCAGQLHATLFILTESQSGSGNTFPVSNTDLLQTSLSSFTINSGAFGGFGGGTAAVLFNGVHGASGPAFDGQNSAPSPNSQITFSLDLVASPLGYDLTQLDSIASWDAGRDGQEYAVEYSTVSAPGTFLSLANVPQFNPSQPFSDAHTRVRLTDTSGVLAANVANLRYTFTSFESGGTAYRELDVIGTPSVPEPGEYAAVAGLALAAFGAWRRLRR